MQDVFLSPITIYSPLDLSLNGIDCEVGKLDLHTATITTFKNAVPQYSVS